MDVRSFCCSERDDDEEEKEDDVNNGDDRWLRRRVRVTQGSVRLRFECRAYIMEELKP